MSFKIGVRMAIIAVAVYLTMVPTELSSQQSAAVKIDNDDIGGVGTSSDGPETRVWGIAQTTDFPTKYAKIVVTHEPGPHPISHLPKANYKNLVRGHRP